MNTKELPNDIDALKKMILQLTDEKELYKKRAAFLEAWIFARKTEKKKALQDPPEQLMLFNEAEIHADEAEEEVNDTEVSEKAPAKRRGHRKSLPEELPRKDIRIDIPEEQKICACGTELKGNLSKRLGLVLFFRFSRLFESPFFLDRVNICPYLFSCFFGPLACFFKRYPRPGSKGGKFFIAVNAVFHLP